ncbi:hypothetical protein Ocin01_19029 [Orchesella cincta]|uniref:Uncharacterized protein n=1 Tax=Orchesella cincta TaxID=48709 RepID=A0A1D2M3U5_ORCCI|nr:hypothetical protein Ocin01_19029 [Orchesella cincta]
MQPNSPASTHQLNGTHTINETENQRRKSARVSLVVGRRSPAGSKRHANRGAWRKLLYKSSQASTIPSHPYEQNGHQFSRLLEIINNPRSRECLKNKMNKCNNKFPSFNSSMNGTHTTNKQTENQRKKPARVSLVVGRKRPAGSKRNANRGDVEKVAIQSSQASTSSQSSIRTKRPSIFQTARNNQQAKKPRVSQKQNVARYVGDDVFGNYHMIKSLDQFKTILQKAQPKHNLSTELVKKLHLRVNHWLEDVFVDLCENTNQPYGFVTFQNLKECMMDQALVPDGISDDDLLMTMKQKMSKEDFKRSEGILYPSRHSKRNDTDDYFSGIKKEPLSR